MKIQMTGGGVKAISPDEALLQTRVTDAYIVESVSEINLALMNYGYAMVKPGITIETSGTIEIAEGQELYIPESSAIKFTCLTCVSSAAIKLTGGRVSGGGKIISEVFGDNMYNPAIGVMIEGSRASVELGSIRGFRYGVHLLGKGKGASYNKINIRQILNCVHAVDLDTETYNGKPGWVNQNFIHVDNITIWSNYDNTGTYGIYIDSHTGNAPNMNVFSGSIEGVDKGVHLTGTYNSLNNLRIEIEVEGEFHPYIEVAATSYGEMPLYNKVYGGFQTFQYEIDYDEDLSHKTLSYESYFYPSQRRKAIQGFGAKGLGMYLVSSGWGRNTDYDDRTLYVNGGGYFSKAVKILSDSTQKENIDVLQNSLDKLSQINGVSFNYKNSDSNYSAYGLIAQEVNEVFPELISAEDSILSLNYDGMIPVLVEAVKSQQDSINLVKDSNKQLNENVQELSFLVSEAFDEIEELKNEINELKEELNELKDELNEDDDKKQENLSGTKNSNSNEAVEKDETKGYLEQNRPNPFTNQTIIDYTINIDFTTAYIAVTNLSGTLLKEIAINNKESNSIEINGEHFSNGIYIYSLVIDGELVDSKKMIINK